MKNKLKILIFSLFAIIIFTSCGTESEDAQNNDSEYGTISAQIIWPDDAPVMKINASGDVSSYAAMPDTITTVTMTVSGGGMTPNSQDFDASLGEGAISAVPVGERTLTCYGKDTNGIILYSGSSAITVAAGQSSEVTVAMVYVGEDITILTDGLVAYYPFNGNANDESGNGNNGMEFGGVSYVDGVKGNAVDFDGIDNYIKISDSNSLNPNSITVVTWFFYKEPAPSSYPAHWILSKMKGSGTGYGLGDGYFDGGGTPASYNELSFTLAVPNNYYSVGSGISPTVNKWIHAVGTYNNITNVTKIFINGVEKGSRTIPNAIVKDNNELTIGVHPANGGSAASFLNGLIDDIRIYNRVLSESEIQSLYNEGNNSTPIANAGTDQNVITGSTVTLDGSGSSNATTYSWSLAEKVMIQ